MDETHTDDLRNVREGDTVVITPQNGGAFTCECVDYSVQNADPRSGEVRETKIWKFRNVDVEIYASIIDGLRSSESDPEFPIHTELYDATLDRGIGYIEKLTIRGSLEHEA